MENIIDKEFGEFEVWLGSFEKDKYKWKVLKKFDNFQDAYKYYHKFVTTQISYSDEELEEVWRSPRIDVELRHGKKKLNWVGIYSRKIDKDVIDEPEENSNEEKEK